MSISAAPLQIAIPNLEAMPLTPKGDQFPFPTRGNPNAPIVVVCDVPSVEAMRQGLPDTKANLKWFADRATLAGFVENDFLFISLCPPMDQKTNSTAKRRWEHVGAYVPGLKAKIEQINPRLVVSLGALAARAVMGRSVKITKSRGVAQMVGSRLIVPMLAPFMVRKDPNYMPIFDADLNNVNRLKSLDFDPTKLYVQDVDYHYVTDLQALVDNKPRALSVDTETTGLDFRARGFKVLTTQLTPEPGKTLIVPHWTYYKRWETEFKARGIEMTRDQCNRLQGQLKALLEDPEIPKIAHNVKYDDGALRHGAFIDVKGWEDDTELMARAVNENFLAYSLDDCVRVYVPEMSGYADDFNQHIDKSRMIDVPPFSTFDEEGNITVYGMLEYAGGDPDAVYRLFRSLWPQLRREKGQMFLYKRVQMRGLLSFQKRIEIYGQCIDRAALEEYEREVATWVAQEEEDLFKLVPADVKRKWLTDPDVQKQLAKRGSRSIPDILYGKDAFLIDVLFNKEIGFKLKPRVFTPSTRKLPPDEQIPSTSTKDHLPYFVTARGKAGEFVNRYRDLKKAKTLLSKYIVNFYKYIKPANDNSSEEKIFPSFHFRTNTHRTNSQDPNGQNFPKRGGKKVDFASGFMRLIKASDGKVIIAADMSQVELRLTAWSAMEPTMLKIYREGGDIHAATAAAVMRLTPEQFALLPGDERKLQRFRAKAVNFGFIYGAMAETFRTYAKTQYEVDYTPTEAEETRTLYFDTYKLLPWHARVEAEVRANGFVRTLHGGVRHLPSVWSDDWSVSSEAVRQAINAPIQWMGSDFGVIAIARLAAQCDPNLMRPIGFVHDQIICEVDPGYVEQGMGWLAWVMENPPLEEWFGIRAPLPFVADPEWGMNLKDTTEAERRSDGTFFWTEKRGEEKIIHELSNLRVEKPGWWNDDEEQAYDRFKASNVIMPRRRAVLLAA